MKFLTSNDPVYRLLRTIAQGVLGVLVANLDLIINQFVIPESVRPVIVLVVMAVLSPIMAYIGEKNGNNE